MEKNNENNIINKDEKEGSDNDEWESIPENEITEETKDVFYRLKFENASKVKNDIFKLKLYHSNKVKKLDSKEIESFYALDKYIKEKYINNISFHHQNNEMPYATIIDNDFVVKKHPEIGTNLIYEVDDNKQELKLIGTSNTWYEATVFKPKVKKRIIKIPKRPVINNKSNNKMSVLPEIKQKEKTNLIFPNDINYPIFPTHNSNIDGNRKLLRRKRRKKKKRYAKDSTIIQIKRIEENKDELEKNKEELESSNLKKDRAIQENGEK